MPDKPKIHAAIFMTTIVYKQDGELRHNTFQSSVTYDEDTELEEVRSSLGKHQVGQFLEAKRDEGIRLKNIRYVVTTPVSKGIMDTYLDHLAGIN